MAISLNILVPVVAALLVNAIIYALGWNKRVDGKEEVKHLPPGWAVGLIWVVILGLLGYLRFVLRESWIGSITIVVVILYCLAYPFYTSGLKQDIGRLMNVIALILAAVAAMVVAAINVWAVPYVLPLLIWSSYVNIAQTL